MQTVYVDVYFLINFTVDLLAFHFAGALMKMNLSLVGMIAAAILGGAYAVALLFLPESILVFIILTVAYFISVLFLCAGGISLARKLKYIAAFLFIELLIGGAVYFAYNALERAVRENSLEEITTNGRLLIIALIILASIGIIKFFLTLFRNNFSESKVRVKLVVFDAEYFTDALVDSGNFATDPMDSSPVMLIKKNFARKIFPYGIPDALNEGTMIRKIQKRIRLIPISTASGKSLLSGFRPDSAYALKNGKYEKINLTIAFDTAEGSFAGFDALIPYVALENI